MPAHKVSIEIDEQFRGRLQEDWLQIVIQKALSLQKEPAAEVSLIITQDETVQQLNRTYRGMDQTTDVLAFALARGVTGSDAPGFIDPPDGLVHLGEVVISYPQAVRQAEEYQHPVEQEIALLVIHGVLHLLGYDHEAPAEEQEMRALETRILSAVLQQGEGRSSLQKDEAV